MKISKWTSRTRKRDPRAGNARMLHGGKTSRQEQKWKTRRILQTAVRERCRRTGCVRCAGRMSAVSPCCKAGSADERWLSRYHFPSSRCNTSRWTPGSRFGGDSCQFIPPDDVSLFVSLPLSDAYTLTLTAMEVAQERARHYRDEFGAGKENWRKLAERPSARWPWNLFSDRGRRDRIANWS